MPRTVKDDPRELRCRARGLKAGAVIEGLALVADEHSRLPKRSSTSVRLEQPQRLAAHPHDARLGVLGDPQQ